MLHSSMPARIIRLHKGPRRRRQVASVVSATCALAVSAWIFVPLSPVHAADPSATAARLLWASTSTGGPTVALGGRRYSLVEASYRVAGSATEWAYTLEPGRAPDQAGVEFRAVDGAGAAVSNLDLVTFLAEKSAADDVTQLTKPAEAEATQLAIWQAAADHTVRRSAVSDGATWWRARTLLRYALARRAAWAKAHPAAGRYMSTQAPAPNVRLLIGGADAETQQVRIELFTGGQESSFDSHQVIDVRLDGTWATVCTQEEDRLDTVRAPTLQLADTACGRERQRGQANGRSANRRYRNQLVRTTRDIDTALVDLPRRDRDQDLEISWLVDRNAGLVFLPTRSTGRAIVLASNATVPETKYLTVRPSALSDFSVLAQQRLLPWYVSHGVVGYVMLALSVVLVLFAKDLLRAVWRVAVGLVKAARGRGAAPGG